jgi:AraC-like DNA-binding protein
MQVTTVPPAAMLAPFVERFVVVESREEVTRNLLPEPGVFLGVRYAGAATLLEGNRATRLPGATLAGIHAAVRRMHTHANSGIVLALFRPAGAARFFRAPLHELFGAHIRLDDLVPRADVERLGARISEAPDAAARADILSAFLSSRMLADGDDPIATAAIRTIVASHGSLRIATLADQLGISQDPLEKRFRRAIGASPKQLATIVRLRHAISIAERGGSWARVAHEAGYFDQSHFNREFRAMTGDSPARFFRAGDAC